MRTTIEISDELHERMRRQAQREGISLARLLGRLVERGMAASIDRTLPVHRSGRFRVIAAGRSDARVTASAVQKVIDEEGIL